MPFRSRTFPCFDRLLFLSGILIPVLAQMPGCQSYAPVLPQELSQRLTAPKLENPIFVENHHHEFLWSVLTDVIDSHFEIAREMPIRLYGNVLTEGYLETKPKIGASLGELWHADSVGFAERFDCTLQTIRRRVEIRAVPETGGYSIEVKVFKDMEDKRHPLKSSAGTEQLRFRENTEGTADRNRTDEKTRWYTVERDAAMENRLLQEIAYRLKHPPEILRKSKEPIRG
ncbi:MAG: hypothetical protein LBH00_10430 [Planctomycetaceae bacterium]|jgi:hypothetical protein|nr:hypothetical protein [Planctomycetaceae bacterium]